MYLFLELSDQPARKSKVGDLKLLEPPDPLPLLTWSDIIADDPFDNEDGVWSNVDFTADSSEDEGSIVTPARSTQESEIAVTRDDWMEDAALAQNYLAPRERLSLEKVIAAQFWESGAKIRQKQAEGLPSTSISDGRDHITELQAAREVLFMLSGLPTSLFKLEDCVTISSNTKYTLRHSSGQSFHHLLNSCAMIGAKLNRLRAWTRKKQGIPLMQTFRAATEERLGWFNQIVSKTQARFVAPQEEVVVSLLSLYSDMQIATRSLLQLSEIVAELDTTCNAGPFLSLELLFHQASFNQASGDDDGFEYMANIFFQCFETYLRPIRQWMNDGELGKDDGTFFVAMNEDKKEPAFLWSEQYRLLEASPEHLHAPNFLHTAAKKIFKIGKSIVFLKELGDFKNISCNSTAHEPRLDYKSVCLSSSTISLVPFPELFDMAFEDWMNSKRHSSLSVLRDHLFYQCGLWKSLDALEYIYFLKDGALSSTIATTIFDKIDRGNEAWKDRFFLTELFQGVYGSLQTVDTERLAVRSVAGGYRDSQNKWRSVKIVASVSVEYNVPWAVANIVKRPSIITYQRVFTFLMQIRRAKLILERQRLPRLHNKYGEKDRIYALRLRLLWFTNTLYAYLTQVVLEPSTADMRSRMANAEDVDSMIAVHETYITHLENRCLLSKKLAPIYRAIISLLDLAILFSDTRTSYAGEASFDLNRSIISTTAQPASQPRRRPRRARADSSSSSEDEDENNEDEVDTSYISTEESTYADKLRKQREQFDHLHSFIAVGVQAVSRTGGETCWEMLAERLAWGRAGRHQ